MMLTDLSTWGVPITMFLGTIGLVWSAAWWLSAKLSDIKKIMFDRLELMQMTVLDKIQYHERHDDERFHDLQNDIWAIKVRNATIDGQRRVYDNNNYNHKPSKRKQTTT